MGIDARMIVVVPQGESKTETEVRRIAHELCNRFGSESFMIDREGKWSDDGTPRHAVSEVEGQFVFQDGPDWPIPIGHQALEVHLYGRYYGENYERGQIGDYILIAMLLEEMIPGCEIFYGGDSSGVCLEPFDELRRSELWDHYAKVGHAPYRRSFLSERITFPMPTCDFCGDVEMVCNSWGPHGRHGFQCMGCEHRVNYTPGGVLVPEAEAK